MSTSTRWLLALFAISAIGFLPLSEWLATSRIGTSLFVWGAAIYAFPLLAALFAIPASIVGLFFRKSRRECAFILLLSLFLFFCFFAGNLLAHRTRMNGMKACALRSQPLIQAIKQYERDHSAPPSSLDDLVPGYLPAVPSTGMMAYPGYEYHVGADAQARFQNNRWALSIFTPGGGINFDMMLYFPDQNYPEYGYGGWLERLEDWAYVHE